MGIGIALASTRLLEVRTCVIEAFRDEAGWLLPLSWIILHRSNHDDKGVSGAEVDTTDTVMSILI